MTNARFGRWNLFRLLQCRTHSIWYTVYTAHVYLHTTGFRELFTHQHGISTALSPFIFHLGVRSALMVGGRARAPRHARGAAGVGGSGAGRAKYETRTKYGIEQIPRRASELAQLAV